MPLTFKINGPNGASSVLKALEDSLTLDQLQEKIAVAINIPADEQKLRAGFPPKDVNMEEASTLVTTLGIPSGSAITVVQKPGGSGGGSNGSSAVTNGGGSSTAANPLAQQLVDMGFSMPVARKALEIAHNDVEAALELCINGVVTEDDLGPSGASAGASSSSSVPSAAPAPSAPVVSFGGMTTTGRVMVRRVIDADNSCLFNAISYLMEKDRKQGAKLRKIIADVVRNRTDVYSEAVLGKTPKEYSDWILDPKHWGGEVEMFILSQYYAAEIVAVEIKSAHAYVYGEGKNYQRRIYVLYDGVHYDALAMAAGSPTASENMDMRQFPAGDEVSKGAALAVAAQLKQTRQFVDLGGATLRCLVCMKGISGEEEARAHARLTSHQNFGQV